MGIRSKAKKIRQLLPIVGAGGNAGNATPPPTTAAPRAQTPQAARPVLPPTPSAPEHGRGNADPQEYIDAVVKGNPVVLFMKGSPGQPMCGFSATAAGVLQSYGKSLHHVDILADPEVRQGVKDYSNWPTIPQVYVGGEFLGGSDILMQMHEQGELGTLIEAACGSE
jgi:monothiol glutaredoxin